MSTHWDYSKVFGPTFWEKEWKTGQQQSPVDIATANVVFSRELADRELAYSDENVGWSIINTGTSVKFEPADACNHSLGVAAGPLKESYQLEQFHIHWGNQDGTGSEHTVNGKTYSGELHLVHWNKAFGSFAAAASQPNGLAVVGLFLEIGDKCESNLEAFFIGLSSVEYKGNRGQLDNHLSPYDLLPKERNAYWTYAGSLTTPPLYESVRWIVCRDPITITADQVQRLRRLKAIGEDQLPYNGNAHPMGSGGCCEGSVPCIGDNYRRPQPLNGRVVESTFTGCVE